MRQCNLLLLNWLSQQRQVQTNANRAHPSPRVYRGGLQLDQAMKHCIYGGLYSLIVEHFPGIEEVVGSSPSGGRNFSHGKLSKTVRNVVFLCLNYFFFKIGNSYNINILFQMTIQGLFNLSRKQRWKSPRSTPKVLKF